MKKIKTMTVEQVARRLGISGQTVRRHCETGILKGAYRKAPVTGSPWVIPETAVMLYEANRKNMNGNGR